MNAAAVAAVATVAAVAAVIAGAGSGGWRLLAWRLRSQRAPAPFAAVLVATDTQRLPLTATLRIRHDALIIRGAPTPPPRLLARSACL